jgi:sucrose-6-phosphate hydrolase SacC (GH32 family)
MGLPDIDNEYYTNPTVENGWQYAIATPRVLELIDNKVYQKLNEELEDLRKNKITK